jgi:site-specific recombinase XerC
MSRSGWAANANSAGLASGQLGAAVNHLVGDIISTRTRQAYSRVWQVLKIFLLKNKLSASLPLSIDNVALYIAYLNTQGYAPTTIASHISAISFVHKINNLTPNPAENFMIQRIIKRLLTNRAPDKRKPLSRDRLLSIIKILHVTCTSAYSVHLFKAMFTLAFSAMLRISEITTGNKSNHTIQFQHLSFQPSSVSIVIAS